jgi:hypothetical protein
MTHSQLVRLVHEQKLTIIFVYGTARSGSTVTQVIFSHLADRAIHEPFTGLLHNEVTQSGLSKFQIDQKVYQLGCTLIFNEISSILKHQDHATIVVKEVSSFFPTEILQQWSSIPEKFLLTIRDPHLQYFSRLNQIARMADSGDSLLHLPMPEKARMLESLDLSTLKLFWYGTLIDNNKQNWDNLAHHYGQIRDAIRGSSKKMAIIDATILRKDSEFAIDQIIEQLGLHAKHSGLDFSKNLQRSKDKVFDIRNPDRPSVHKARHSKEVEPLGLEESISPYYLPLSSQEHISQTILPYLQMFYGPERAAMPSLHQLDISVSQSDTWKLEDI